MKSKLSAILAAGLLLLLSGCARQPPAPSAPTTEPTQTTAPAETTAPTLPPLEAVNIRTCYTFSDYAYPSCFVLDERTVLLHSVSYGEEYEEGYSEGEAPATTTTDLVIVDLYADEILHQLSLEQELYLGVQQMLDFIPLYDYPDGCIYLLNRRLELIGSFHPENTDGVFTADMRYYYLHGGKICCQDHRGNSFPLDLPDFGLQIQSIAGIDTRSNVLLLNVYTEYYGTATCQAALDLATGELLMLSMPDSYGTLTENGVCFRLYSEDFCNYNLAFTDWGSDQFYSLSRSIPDSESNFSWQIPYSSYYLHTEYLPEEDFSPCGHNLYRFDQGLQAADLFELLDGCTLQDAMILPDGNLVGFSQRESKLELVLICPDKLAFTDPEAPVLYDAPVFDGEILLAYQAQKEGPALPETLAEVRREADQLQEEFGVTILISSQCADATGACAYPITTTDQAELSDEASYIHDALTELRSALALYPEGFFRQFRDEAGQRGLLILLVETIHSDNNAIGVAYEMGKWYPIAVDVTYYDMYSTYIHEIWHATETKITNQDYWLLNDGSWEALNPPEFSYSYDTTTGYIDEVKWTYISGDWGTKSCFVDSYSRVNAKEDRARLMEYIMAYDYWAEDLMTAPVLHQKLGIMIQAIRQVFDTTGWENVYWERFHPEA